MAQNITLNIAGSTFSLSASSPEQERLMRLAAENVNAMFENYNAKFPQKTPADKLAMVALSEAVAYMSAQNRAAKVENALTDLDSRLGSYLSDKIEHR